MSEHESNPECQEVLAATSAPRVNVEVDGNNRFQVALDQDGNYGGIAITLNVSDATGKAIARHVQDDIRTFERNPNNAALSANHDLRGLEAIYQDGKLYVIGRGEEPYLAACETYVPELIANSIATHLVNNNIADENIYPEQLEQPPEVSDLEKQIRIEYQKKGVLSLVKRALNLQPNNLYNSALHRQRNERERLYREYIGRFALEVQQLGV